MDTKPHTGTGSAVHAGRYQAINLTPDHTIEVRIFRGTLKPATLLASIEFVDWAIGLVKRMTNTQLQALTWEQALGDMRGQDYRYLPAYLNTIWPTSQMAMALDTPEEEMSCVS